MKTLIISGHPNIDNSLANKTILESIQNGNQEVTIRHIAQLYPDFKIDAKAEQTELLKHDTIIFQFPFYWYSTPAILKHWFDIVFEYQFAYGSQGDKLKGKNCLLSITIGGPQDSYAPLGYNHFRIEELLKPLEQTIYLAQMNYLDPIYTHSMIFIEGVYNKKEEVVERAKKHAEKVLKTIK